MKDKTKDMIFSNFGLVLFIVLMAVILVGILTSCTVTSPTCLTPEHKRYQTERR